MNRVGLFNLVIALAVCTSTQLFAADDVVIRSIRDGNIERVYSVPRESLTAADNRWNPETSELPIDLAAHAETARKYLVETKKPQEPIKLRGFSLSQHGDFRLKGDRPWVLEFRFADKRPGEVSGLMNPEWTVVMLLNGRIAQYTTNVIANPK